MVTCAHLSRLTDTHTHTHTVYPHLDSADFCLVTLLVFSSLLISAQEKILIISKPFVKSLSANPMFGRMSHPPHLPQCAAARGPFTNTGQGPPASPVGPSHCWGWGWGFPPTHAGITRPSKVKSRGRDF